MLSQWTKSLGPQPNQHRRKNVRRHYAHVRVHVSPCFSVCDRDVLSLEAVKRKISMGQLVTRLIERVVSDKLFAAVLDD